MKTLQQLSIILSVTFIAEIIKYLVPLPIPASIYGMLLMFFALKVGWVKLDQVHSVGNFLIEIMPIMFIPAAVGLLVSFHQLENIFLPVILIIILTTFIVSAVTGRVTQWIIRRERSHSHE